MTRSNPISSDERIVDAMIQLARATKSQRLIVAGSSSADIFLELHRRGYARIATMKTCRFPCAQHDVAFVASGEESAEPLETTLDRLVHYLGAAGILVIWIGPHERMPNRKIRLALDRLGFRIQSGTACESGVAISARRLQSTPAAQAA